MDTMAPKGPTLSVIIPVRDGEATLAKCLDALNRHPVSEMEVIVVDDGSGDSTREIAKGYPVKLIGMCRKAGASAARNAGARAAQGDALFFTDSDCLVREGTLQRALDAYTRHPEATTGGTYTPMPHDKNFFSVFQSVFINYSETKKRVPDYVATHCMVIDRNIFLRSGGFNEDFMPILEDVELSHRLKREGVELRMEPNLMVEHIFGFSLWASLKNAFRKSMYWTMYSIKNQDLLKDSGTASRELKVNVLGCYASSVLVVLAVLTGSVSLFIAAGVILLLDLIANAHFIGAVFRVGGASFGIKGLLYYLTLYPVAVGAGGIVGALKSAQ